MHDGMQYDPIQGEGYEPLKVGNYQGWIFDFCPSFMSCDFEVGSK